MRIYLDHNSTTPIDSRVADAMLPYLFHDFGNPSSAHSYGWDAECALEKARQQVAQAIHANPDEIFFTSGATEANNTVLRWAYETKRPLYSSPVEHKSVLLPCNFFKEKGHPVFFLDVDKNACPLFENVVFQEKALLSLMAVNNEIHSVSDLLKIGNLCHKNGVLFHTDCSQALGKIKIDVTEMGIDLLSISGHKIYGPKGIGALYIKKKHQADFTPLMMGGGQERGLRGGTVPVFLCVALGEACEISAKELKSHQEHLHHLSRYFLKILSEKQLNYELIGQPVEQRQAGGLSLFIHGLNAREWCEKFSNIAISQGSACNSKSASHVLSAIHIPEHKMNGIIRVGFGKENSKADVEVLAQAISTKVTGQST